jgi:exosortase/archaeosortase family protein
LRASPRLGWLAAGLAGALGSVLSLGVLPPLVGALLALGAFGAALAAFLPAQVASAPVIGLSLLSLPWIASLQFYAGFPLRVVTAEASRWLLVPLFAVERSGTALRVDGQLVIVDAPCSGVQLLWLGYFTACAAALYTGRDSRGFLARLPLVSVFVLAGNIVRNTVLVGLEGAGHGSSGWMHDAVGLLVLAAVCSAIAIVMSRRVCNEGCAPAPVRKQACTPCDSAGEQHV